MRVDVVPKITAVQSLVDWVLVPKPVLERIENRFETG